MPPRSLICCLVALVLPIFAGCATRLGARSLPGVRIDYNQAVAASGDEQMLLNVVRMRYLHTPTFLQLNSVVTQYSLTTDAGVSGTYNHGAAGGPLPEGNVGGSTGVTISERPTITYTPLQGEDFVRRVAKPMPTESLLFVLQAGWGWDIVMSCCVERINDSYAPFVRGDDNGDFRKIADLLHQLQRGHELSVEEVTTDGRPKLVIVFRKEGGDHSAKAREAMALLGIDPVLDYYDVTSVSVNRLPGTVTLQPRSVLGALFHLSQGVEVPDGDVAIFGTDTFDGSMPVISVKAAKRSPKDAYVSVKYRDRWYYVAETDITSKRVFVLLTFLFNLMAAPAGQGPVLTVGASG